MIEIDYEPQHKFGAIPSIPDIRDDAFSYAAIRGKPKVLPVRTNNRQYRPPLRDQGNRSTCTGYSTTYGLHFMELVKWGKMLPLSVLFPYYYAGVLEGTETQDNGRMIHDIAKVLAKKGICLDRLWGYENDYADEPNKAAQEEGLLHKLVSYHKINSIDEIFENLADRHPVIGGVAIYPSTEKGMTAPDGVVPMPGLLERLLGLHALLFYDYDMSTKRLTTEGSWGQTGDNGDHHFPFSFIENPKLSLDFLTFRAANV